MTGKTTPFSDYASANGSIEVERTSNPVTVKRNGEAGYGAQPNGISHDWETDLCSESDFEPTYEPIAITGCAMRLPGNVSTEEDLWNLLDGQKEGRCRVPLDRYNVDAFHGPGKSGHTCTEYGHFLQNIDLAQADDSFWSTSRSETEAMDPQQRLALEVVYECFEKSGVTNWRGKNIGAYFGTFGEDWSEMQGAETQQTGVYRTLGTADFVVANRVSYEFGLRGPSIVIRTACSSSLTALHEACLAVQRGECESAIVGGTNLILNPRMTMTMTEQGVLSPDGRCKTFDQAANGYSRGEGVVAIHIKRFVDAIRDKDPIRAVIRSTCTNSDGRTAGLTQPNPASHEALMRRSHALAGIRDMSKTAMIECHGTGTAIGDPLEAMAVGKAFGGEDIYIGSIKPNLGHGEGASGITSILKAMLALERSLIPPNAHFKTPNPKIPFEQYNLKVPTQTTPWPVGKAERIGVNSFGIGGANAHVLLDSAREMGIVQRSPAPVSTQNFYLLPFSAASANALKANAESHKAYLSSRPESIADLSYTLALRREPLPYRAFLVAPTNASNDALQLSSIEKVGEYKETAFVFTGQGAQWPGMAASLLISSEIFRDSIAAMQAALETCASPPQWSLREELLKPKGSSRLTETEFSQPCCTAIQIALVDVLLDWGLVPGSIVGHSSGEVAAAYAAGALTAEDAICIAYYRGLGAKAIAGRGGMAAIGLGREAVTPFLGPGVVIGCENSPQSVTLSGDVDVMADIMSCIKEAYPEVFVRALRVDCAYHSPHMQAVGQGYSSMVSQFRAREPTTPFFSSVTGGRILDRPLDGSYWTENFLSPVLFNSAVSQLLQHSNHSKILIEIGPHAALAGPLRQIIQASNASAAKYISTLVRDQDATSALLQCAGNLFQHGVELDFQAIAPHGRPLVDLPAYSWQRSGHHWKESRLSKDWRQRAFPTHDILGDRVIDTSGHDPTWRRLLRIDDVPWTRDHGIGRDVVFPGAAYVAMAGEAVRQLSARSAYTVRAVQLTNALILQEESSVEIVTHLKPRRLTNSLDSVWYDFEISSLNGERWVKHAFGQVRAGSDVETTPPLIEPKLRSVCASQWYAVLKGLDLHYGPRFQGLQQISADVVEERAVARLDNTREPQESYYAIHPSLIDSVFQTFSVASSKGLAREFKRLCVPTYIGEMYINPTLEEILAEANTTTSPRGVVSGDVVGTTSEGLAFGLKELKLLPLTEPDDSQQDYRHAAAELVWKPDISFLDKAELVRVVNYDKDLTRMVDRMSVACIMECSLMLEGKTPCHGFLAKFADWLEMFRRGGLKGTYTITPDFKEISAMSSSDRALLIKATHTETASTDLRAVSEALHRVYRACTGIFEGSIEPLELLMKDDILHSLYNVIQDAVDCSDFFILAAHNKPNMRILEIGAGTGGTTNKVLQAIGGENPQIDRGYRSYTYTDVSPGFFTTAMQRFKDYAAIEYKVLDISIDPIAQGFEAESFDLIIATDVIHATPCLQETLANVRRLLAPNGTFFLQELAPPTKWLNFVWGILPGWWLGDLDGRIHEPYVAPKEWDKLLQDAGFAGSTAVKHDGRFNATMIVDRSVELAPWRVTLLSMNPSHRSVSEVATTLVAHGFECDIRTIGQVCPLNQDVVFLADIDGSFLHDVEESAYTALQETVKNLRASRVLWVTGLAQIKCSDPRFGMVLGLARTLRTEASVDLATLELEAFDDSGWEALASILPVFQDRAIAGEMKPEMEWVFVDGLIHIPRFSRTSVDVALAHENLQGPARRLVADKPGSLASVQWKDFTRVHPQPDQVQLNVRAVGLNFKDVLMSLGIVEPSASELDALGCGCAGVIESIGSDKHYIRPGDPCMALSGNAFSTLLNLDRRLCVKIPNSLSFENAAAMSLVFTTAIRGLVDIASIEKGQSVLIHSACGGVGLAAIQVCQYIGAEIYCTVGNEEKVRHLMEVYNIPREHIFSSRDITFQRDLLTATHGRGVDVVLNSLSGELLHASWKCVAPFGYMIEIGKRDLIGKGALALDPFEHNRSYAGVDMIHLCSERPDIVARLLQKVMVLYEYGAIKPITPLKCFDAYQVQEAMQVMKNGDHIGKMVITLPENVEDIAVSATRRKLRLPGNASYILVGGLGGLGRAIAIWMAEAGATEILFLSRSADKMSHSSFAQELERLGCKAVMVAGSVTELSAVEEAVDRASKPVRGVVQASMVLRDAPFASMSFSDWQTATRPKVQGTWNLHQVLQRRDIAVDFFLLFGSLTGLAGYAGQANYAAANTFLCSFAQYRRNRGLAAVCVDIGAMEDIGYVSHNTDVLEHFRRTSVRTLREQDLLDALQLMMDRSKPTSLEQAPNSFSDSLSSHRFVSRGHFAIGLGSTKPLSAPDNRTTWKDDPRMAALHNSDHADLSGPVTGTDQLEGFLADVALNPAALETSESAQLLATEIGKTLFGFLMLDIQSLNVEQSLDGLGIDSLVSIELRSWLKRKLKIEMTVLEILGSSTILDLGQRAASRLGERHVGGSTS